MYLIERKPEENYPPELFMCFYDISIKWLNGRSQFEQEDKTKNMTLSLASQPRTLFLADSSECFYGIKLPVGIY